MEQIVKFIDPFTGVEEQLIVEVEDLGDGLCVWEDPYGSDHYYIITKGGVQ